MKSPREAFDITQRYWRNVPVRVDLLAAELGLGPVIDSELPSNISGKIVRLHDNAWRIHVNAKHSGVRRRFTIAHEIGHFIYHRELLRNGVSDTLAYRADDVICPNPLIGPQQEWQANNFAANLLVPEYYLRAARAAGFTEVTELAQRFEVSDTAMRIRLGLPIPDSTPSVLR